MSEERYLEQEINKDLRILELERQLEEAKEELDLAVKHLPTKKKLEFVKYLKEKGDETR